MSIAENSIVPASTSGETMLDVASFVSSAIPWIGGPVSNVLGGMSFGRKLGRVREVLEGVTGDLKDFKTEASKEYVKTDEFEDLLEQALKRASEERSEQKRQMYRRFLVDAIEVPGKPYDEQLRILRTLEQIQPDHLKVVQALDAAPNLNTTIYAGSPLQVLQNRLPEMDGSHIRELVEQLNDLKLTNMTSLGTLMTGAGAESLGHSISKFGCRFLAYTTEA